MVVGYHCGTTSGWASLGQVRWRFDSLSIYSFSSRALSEYFQKLGRLWTLRIAMERLESPRVLLDATREKKER